MTSALFDQLAMRGEQLDLHHLDEKVIELDVLHHELLAQLFDTEHRAHEERSARSLMNCGACFFTARSNAAASKGLQRSG